MRTLQVASLALAVVLAACGGHSQEPVPVRPEPPAVPAPTKVAPTPTAPHTPATPPTPTATATPAPPGPSAPPGPTPREGADPSTVPVADGTVVLPDDVEVAQEPVGDGFAMTADVVTLPDAARTTALSARVKADARRVLASDENARPPQYEGTCQATLVTPDLVSYMCRYTAWIPGDREDTTIEGRTGLTYAFDGARPRPVSVESFFVDGTDVDVLADAACRKAALRDGGHLTPSWTCGADTFAFSLQSNGVRIGWNVWDDGGGSENDDDRNELVLSFEELGKLVRGGSAAASIAPAEHLGDDTPLAEVAGPPPPGTMVTAIGDEGPLTSVAKRWAFETGVRVMVTDAAAGRGRLVRERYVAFASVDRGNVTRTSVPYVQPQLGLDARRARRFVSLRTAPRIDAPVVAPLAAGTLLAVLTGPVAGGDSDLGPAMWVYAVASGTVAGWAPSGALGASVYTPPHDETDGLVARFAADERAAATDRIVDVVLSARRTSVAVHYAASADGAHTELLAVTAHGGDATIRTSATLDGTVADLRLTRTARDGDTLLLVALARPTLPPGSRQWQALRLVDATAAAVVLDLPLPTDATLPAAQRATVRGGIQFHGHFAPLLVHGPGGADVLYGWNGTALVAGGT